MRKAYLVNHIITIWLWMYGSIYFPPPFGELFADVKTNATICPYRKL